MAKKQSFKQGEKILFGIFGIFIVVAVLGFIALEFIRAQSDKPLFEMKTHFNLSDQGKKGSIYFREARCTACHRAMRNGTNMGLSLDGIGSKRTLEWIRQFIANPEEVYGARTLDHGLPPKEAAYTSELPPEQQEAIAVFLSQLKADQGSPSSPIPPEGSSGFIDNMLEMWVPESWREKYSDVRTKEAPLSQEEKQ